MAGCQNYLYAFLLMRGSTVLSSVCKRHIYTGQSRGIGYCECVLNAIYIRGIGRGIPVHNYGSGKRVDYECALPCCRHIESIYV